MALATAPQRPKVRLNLPALRVDQSKIARHPAKIKVLAMGRRWGKTILGMVLAICCAIAGGRVAWIVPTYKNSRAIWRLAEGTASRLGRKVVTINKTDRTITFRGTNGFLAIYSADNPDAIRGEAFNLVIIDEAARIDEEVWTDVIQPTLADADGDAILISTPKGRNWFWREFQRGMLDGQYIKSWRAPSRNNPSPQIQRAAEMAKVRVPKNTYDQEWEAEFVEDSATVFSETWWAEGRNRYQVDDKLLRNRIIARWISIDTAMKDKDSSDYSAATVAELTRDWRLVIREVWRDKLRFPDLISAIERLYLQYSLDHVPIRAVIIEDKVSGTSAYQTLTSGTANPYLARLMVAYQPKGSKRVRASLAGVWCRNDCVLLPYPGDSVPWLLPFEEELYSFTGTDEDTDTDQHDDQVDTLSQVILYLEETEHIMSTGYYARLESDKRKMLQAGYINGRAVAHDLDALALNGNGRH